MKNEQKAALMQGLYKRLSVNEHQDRIRFDPTLVQKLLPNNKFKLIYPKINSSDSYE